jgi:hypothetical protein
LGAASLLLAVVGSYLLWSALRARADLRQAAASAERMQDALVEGDTQRADRELRQFAASTDSARGRTAGPLWGAATHLPFIGDDARAVRLLASSASEVGRQAYAALFGEDDRDLLGALAPRQGRVDLDAVRQMAPLVGDLARTLSIADLDLAEVDSRDLIGSVRGPFEDFRDRVDDAQRAAAAAEVAVQVLPSMLGEDESRTYLVRFNNNAEIRPSGGMPGAWALVNATAGKVSMVRQGAVSGTFSELDQPVLPQPPAEREIYDVHPATFFQDTGFIPDFPRSAELARAMWDKRFPDRPIDGVLEIDAVTVGYLLRATGPIEVGGVHLTAANAADELLNKVYLRLPDNARQDEFYVDVAQQVFDKVSSGVQSPVELVEALSAGVTEGRVHLHSFDDAVQSRLDDMAIASRLRFDADDSPELGIYLSDTTGSKMSYYLHAAARTRAADCRDNVASYTTDLTFSQDDVDTAALNEFITGTGAYGTPKGQQLVSVRIYAPVGGAISDFTVDGRPTQLAEALDRGRRVYLTAVVLAPGQQFSYRWTTSTTSSEDLVEQLTPGLEPRPYETRVRSAC